MWEVYNPQTGETYADELGPFQYASEDEANGSAALGALLGMPTAVRPV